MIQLDDEMNEIEPNGSDVHKKQIPIGIGKKYEKCCR